MRAHAAVRRVNRINTCRPEHFYLNTFTYTYIQNRINAFFYNIQLIIITKYSWNKEINNNKKVVYHLLWFTTRAGNITRVEFISNKIHHFHCVQFSQFSQLCLQVLKSIKWNKTWHSCENCENCTQWKWCILFEMNSTRVMLPARVVNQSKW
jgi:hypothetical protein